MRSLGQAARPVQQGRGTGFAGPGRAAALSFGEGDEGGGCGSA